MTLPKIFIDGEHGTTGLQIRDRLEGREDLVVVSLAHADRRDDSKRKTLLRESQFAILCLPDDASREAVSMINEAGAPTRVIDTSTAHRVSEGWVYGFAESQNGLAEKISNSSRVANPGCYSTGAIALLAPLVNAGLLPADYPITINAVSGYTGGGKQLIAQMENADADGHISESHFLYALGLAHKHVPEIIGRCGLTRTPIFTPNVGRFAQGMLVNIPLHLDMTNANSRTEIHAALADHYAGQSVVKVRTLDNTDGLPRICPEELANTDEMNLYVTGNDTQINLVAQLDNLGKGASGAAVQNLNLMLAAQ